MASSSVPKLYYGVIEDVISNVREAFIDEGVDEQILSELKQVWERKVVESKVIEKEPSLKSAHLHTNSTASIAHHQLGMPATATMLPQALLQYTTSSNSGGEQKPMAIKLQPQPQGVTLGVPAHMSQSSLQALISSGTNAVQLTPEMAASFFQFAQPNQMAPQATQNLAGVHYQTLSADALKQGPYTVTIPVTQQQQQQQAQQAGVMGQVDGQGDTSDDDDDDDFQDNEDDPDDNDDDQNVEEEGEEDEEPLNSDDDVSEEDPTDLFDTENVVVCQYDKITRSKNRWKFHLKDGIMNLKGKDFVFQKALGDSEW